MSHAYFSTCLHEIRERHDGDCLLRDLASMLSAALLLLILAVTAALWLTL